MFSKTTMSENWSCGFSDKVVLILNTILSPFFKTNEFIKTAPNYIKATNMTRQWKHGNTKISSKTHLQARFLQRSESVWSVLPSQVGESIRTRYMFLQTVLMLKMIYEVYKQKIHPGCDASLYLTMLVTLSHTQNTILQSMSYFYEL